MMYLVRAELLKVRTTRLWIGLLLAGLGLTALGTVLLLAVTSSAEGTAAGLEPIRTAEDVRELVFSGAGSLAFVLVLAATMATSEFRYGTVASTYLATPSRGRVISAKTLAAAPIGFGYGAVAAAASVLIAAVWLTAHGDALPFGTPVLVAIGQVGLQCAYGAAIAVGVGAALRSQLMSILGLLGWLFVIEPLTTALVPRFARWAPFARVGRLLGGASNVQAELFGPFGAAVLALTYVAAIWASAVWFESRRDV
jgi:ABC-2 type transport system permease protein